MTTGLIAKGAGVLRDLTPDVDPEPEPDIETEPEPCDPTEDSTCAAPEEANLLDY